jgi:hypothetical protein
LTDPAGYAVRDRDATVGASTPTGSDLSLALASTPGATLSAGPGTSSAPAGESVQTTLTLGHTGGYSGTASFDCENLSAGATCSFSPGSRSTPGTTVLMIATRSAALGTLLLGGLG